MYYAIENVQTSTEQIFFNRTNWTLKTENKRKRRIFHFRILNEKITNPSWLTKEAGKVYIEWKKKTKKKLNWISKQYTNQTMCVQFTMQWTRILCVVIYLLFSCSNWCEHFAFIFVLRYEFVSFHSIES